MKNTESNAVEVELSKNRSNLYIFFGGIAAGINMPPFEFYNSAKIIDENKIFIRDFSQSWYQNGLSKISKDIDSTVNFLKLQIKTIKPHKIFFVGNSMGGYAAIMFAQLIGKGPWPGSMLYGTHFKMSLIWHRSTLGMEATHS